MCVFIGYIHPIYRLLSYSFRSLNSGTQRAGSRYQQQLNSVNLKKKGSLHPVKSLWTHLRQTDNLAINKWLKYIIISNICLSFKSKLYIYEMTSIVITIERIQKNVFKTNSKFYYSKFINNKVCIPSYVECMVINIQLH